LGERDDAGAGGEERRLAALHRREALLGAHLVDRFHAGGEIDLIDLRLRLPERSSH
jgi:hypothetical protein